MDMIDKLLQLLEVGYMNERDIEEALGRKWSDIGESIGIMKMSGWLNDMPPYLTEASRGRRFYITLSGREEYKRRKEAGKKAAVANSHKP